MEDHKQGPSGEKEKLFKQKMEEGFTKLKEKTYVEALESFKMAASYDIDQEKMAHALHSQALVYRAQGNHEQALLFCEKAMDTFPTSFLPIHDIVQWSETMEVSELWLPLLLRVKRNLIKILQMDSRKEVTDIQEKNNRLIAQIKEIISEKNKKALILNNQGIEFSNKGQFDQAIEKFRQAIQLNPKCGLAFHNYAVSLSKQGKYDLVLCKQAIEYLKPKSMKDSHEDYHQALLHFGYACYMNSISASETMSQREHLRSEAEYQFQTILKDDPEHVPALYNLALVYTAYKSGKASDCWEKITKCLTETSSVQDMLWIGKAHKMRGDYGKAKQIFSDAWEKSSRKNMDARYAYIDMVHLMSPKNKLDAKTNFFREKSVPYERDDSLTSLAATRETTTDSEKSGSSTESLAELGLASLM